MSISLERLPDILILDESEGVYLRPTAPDDADALFELVDANPYLQEYQQWTRNYTPELAREGVARALGLMELGEWMQYRLMRQDRHATLMIGTITLHEIDRDAHTAALGYYIAEQEQGKGLASRASRLVLERARDQYDLQQILLRIEAGNLPSEYVARKLGAELTDKVHMDDEQVERRIWEIKL